MGSGLSKKKQWWTPMPSYARSPEEEAAYQWCVKNNIKISPFAASSDKVNNEWWIDIETNNLNKRSPYKYNRDQIWSKIFELYVFYYKKYGLRNTV
jgi:hypothetical protein|tara:strand:+ start:1199 stop:1486 length:288 start_codon:yes stop_codon:yes gene_type:complete